MKTYTSNPYIEENKERFVEELFDLLKIPSVSAKSEYKDDVRKAAEYIKQKFLDAGVDHAEICETSLHPIVYAEKTIDASLPTVLVYGHYDCSTCRPMGIMGFSSIRTRNKR